MSDERSPTNAMMLAVNALDPRAALRFSEYTRQWYVEAHVEIGDGTILAGCAEHRDTPEAAVAAFFDRLTSIDLDRFVVAFPFGQRREYRWNGAAFAEIPSRLAVSS